MATKTGGSPTTERGEGTRRRILELAAEAIAEHGYNGISLNDLIRSSGMTKGAFYFHFESKEALAFEVYRFKQEGWAARVLAEAAEHDRALDRLIAMAEASIEIARTDPAARAVQRMCTELTGDPAMAERFRPFLDLWVEVTTQTVREAQAQGDVRSELDPVDVANVCVAGFMGIEQLSDVMSGRRDLADRVHAFMDLIIPSIATDQRRTHR